MLKQFLLLGLAGTLTLAATTARAQAPLTTSPYTQNFDGLANTGTANAKTTLPTGWDLLETGSSALADNAYGADNGASNAGNTYSYGAAGTTERAFGSLLSGTLKPVIGASFTNNSGAALTALTVTYSGETWRIGTIGHTDKLIFEYSTDATSLSTGTWTAVTALDYTNNSATATTTGTPTAPTQTATITSVIGSLNIATGTTFWFRWTDSDASSSDDGLAVDDFSLSWTAPSTTSPVLTATPTSLAFGNQNMLTTSAAQTYSLSGANLTGVTTLTAAGPFTISKDNTTYGTSLTYTAADLATAKTVYVKFAPTAAGTVTGTVTQVSAGATSVVVNLSGTGVNPNQNVFSFDNCTSATVISDGWIQYSVTGAQTWACTTFGHDPADATGTLSKVNGVQMNGYATGTGNVANEDWLISPAFNLTAYSFPLFSYWSRTAFAGPGLQLRVSTNYTGSGDPTLATWTTLNAQFPASTSDVWTQASPLNLSAYKSASVYVAFVYTSTTAAAARWTLDDITLTNSTTAPAPTFFTDLSALAYGFRTVNSTTDKTLILAANDLTGNVTVTSSSTFYTVSKDGTTFASSVTLTPAEVNNTSKTLTVRFKPTTASTNYGGTLTLATAGATSKTVALSGDTYDPATTLELVNWNVEWFGSTVSGMGPSDKPLQQTNVTKVLTDLKADVYALCEVVSLTRIQQVVTQLSANTGNTYAYQVSDFGSYADDANDVDYADDQKLAFIYNTAVISNPTFVGLLRCTQAQACAAYTPWASGRFPYMMTATVTLNGVSKQVRFIVIHAKANSASTSANDWQRRKDGADLLKAYLDTNYPNDNILIVGDYNDVLNGTIATGVTPAVSSYNSFVQDVTNYSAISLPLANSGAQSTASYKTLIDNVIATNDMAPYYLSSSVAVRTDITSTITNYANTTSDHYPIFSRYSFAGGLATKNAGRAQLALYPNPVTNTVRLEVPETGSNLSLQVHTVDGRLVLRGSGSVQQLNEQLGQRLPGLTGGLYLIQVTGAEQTYTNRFQKL